MTGSTLRGLLLIYVVELKGAVKRDNYKRGILFIRRRSINFVKGEVQEINSQIKVQKELPPAFLLQGKMMNVFLLWKRASWNSGLYWWEKVLIFHITILEEVGLQSCIASLSGNSLPLEPSSRQMHFLNSFCRLKSPELIARIIF